ncbi:MAG: signal peptidase I [Bacteroidales bacterium]|nr:signal peptidase I [Bacteroidales bacterium]
MLYNLFALIYIFGPFIGLCFVFKKVGIAPWKALIPIYNIVLWIKICGKNWKWYIYFLIPAINIFTFLMLVVETAKVFGRHGFWEQTLAVIMPFAYIPYLGLSKLEYQDPATHPAVKYSQAREWLDAIVFALVAAVIIRGNCFEFYKIPSSSMEKSLLVGDYLMVSKMAYGPRSVITPLSFPLVHNVMPFSKGECESYLPWIKLPYHRFPGTSHVKRFDATVFNYPDGDTVCTAFQSNASYHDLVREFGRETVHSDRQRFGKVVVRPLDKRENFIKRCIGLPGETLEIKHQQVFINGNAIENPADLEFTYAIRMKESMADFVNSLVRMGTVLDDVEMAKMQKDASFFHSIGISNEDCNMIGIYQYAFMNDSQIAAIERNVNFLDLEPMEYTHADSSRLVRVKIMSTLDGRSVIDTLRGTFKALGIPDKEFELMFETYTLPLTSQTKAKLESSGMVAEIMPLSAMQGYSGLQLFPHAAGYSWSVDNYGPVTIPAKGKTIALTADNLPIYRRAIEFFENNTLETRDGKIIINGKETTEYTFKMDYYWMMGDNRHNSADSRFWGFVPEDHIVGRASMVVFSRDQDSRKTRWNRLFKRKL